MKLLFLCGCLCEINTGFVAENKVDAAGMLVCPSHGERRYGWRSHGRNWNLANLTPYELEQHVIFKIMPERVQAKVKSPESLDLRDNRNPQEAWVLLEDDAWHHSYSPQDEWPDEITDAARKRLSLEDRKGWPLLDSREIEGKVKP